MLHEMPIATENLIDDGAAHGVGEPLVAMLWAQEQIALPSEVRSYFPTKQELSEVCSAAPPPFPEAALTISHGVLPTAAHPKRRPTRADRPPNDQLTREGSPHVRVVRIFPVVAKHEDVTVRHIHLSHTISRRQRDIWLILRLPIHIKASTPQAHAVTAHGNHTLDHANIPASQRELACRRR